MYIAKLKIIVCLMITLFVVGQGWGQTIPTVQVDSIDASILNSKSIVIGTVSKVETAENPPGDNNVTILVTRTIKGPKQKTLQVLLGKSAQLLLQWQAQSTPLLFLLPLKSDQKYAPLDNGLLNLNDPHLLVCTEDFAIFRKSAPLIHYISEVVRKNPTVDTYPTFSLSINYNSGVEAIWQNETGLYVGGVTVPIDRALERHVLSEIHRGSRPNGVQQYSLEEAVRGLAFFRSRSNIRILEGLLNNTSDFNDYANFTEIRPRTYVGLRTYPVRDLAYKTLLAWGVQATKPKIESFAIPESLTTLTWGGNLNGFDLEYLRSAKNLQFIDLQPSTCPDELMPTVAKLTQLTELKASGLNVNDAVVLELAKLKNLQSLSLRENPISDEGLMALSKLKRLKTLDVFGTEITDNGIARFRKARPDVNIFPDSVGTYLQYNFTHQSLAECNKTIYSLDPKDKELANWRSITTGSLTGPIQWSKTPHGSDYLGPFGQQAVTLKLTHLPVHKNIHIAIELFLIGSWDGNGMIGPGPDILDISIPKVGTLMHSTFFNNTEGAAANLRNQSFPDPYPWGHHFGFTGASEVRSLGFQERWNNTDYKRDGVYNVNYTFSDSGKELEIVITGENVVLPGTHCLTDDENWGIGNLIVKTD